MCSTVMESYHIDDFRIYPAMNLTQTEDFCQYVTNPVSTVDELGIL